MLIYANSVCIIYSFQTKMFDTNFALEFVIERCNMVFYGLLNVVLDLLEYLNKFFILAIIDKSLYEYLKIVFFQLIFKFSK